MVQGGFIFAGVLLIMIAVFTVVYHHLNPRCSDEIVSESASPDRQWVATIMQRRCGEESAFVIHVNLRSANRSIRHGFFSGKAEEAEVFSIEQDATALHLNLVWDSPSQLTIHCRGCANASNKQERWNGVLIRYQ
jgi:hypothetical protein